MSAIAILFNLTTATLSSVDCRWKGEPDSSQPFYGRLVEAFSSNIPQRLKKWKSKEKIPPVRGDRDPKARDRKTIVKVVKKAQLKSCLGPSEKGLRYPIFAIFKLCRRIFPLSTPTTPFTVLTDLTLPSFLPSPGVILFMGLLPRPSWATLQPLELWKGPQPPRKNMVVGKNLAVFEYIAILPRYPYQDPKQPTLLPSFFLSTSQTSGFMVAKAFLAESVRSRLSWWANVLSMGLFTCTLRPDDGQAFYGKTRGLCIFASAFVLFIVKLRHIFLVGIV